MLCLPAKVSIREVAPRDGFQSWPRLIPTAIKIAVIKRLVATGIAEIETASFVDPRKIPQMADAAEIMATVPRGGVVHTALVPNLKGARAALEAGADRLNVVISASEAHNAANLNCTIARSLATLVEIAALARERRVALIGSVAVSFGCPLSGRVDMQAVVQLVEAYAIQGVQTVILADTTGMATPLRIIQRVTDLKTRFANLEFGLHLHNNRGAAMANLFAGLQAGVTIFDTSLGGIGGCPNVPLAAGNLASEDVVCMLTDMGIETGIDLESLLAAARFMQKSLNHPLPGQVIKSGPILPAKLPGGG